ncbi:MAG: cellulose synthase operon protein YhjQ/BcsQ [Acidimicrobiales bacterium]
MLIVCWSAKGGVGTTTVAAALGVAAARVQPDPPVLLVDLTGDLPACLGLTEPGGPGAAEWLASGTDVPPDALVRLQVPVVDGLDLLPRGHGPLDAGRAPVLAQVLAASGRTVVVDAGLLGRSEVAAAFVAGAGRSVLVTRLCFLGLRRAVAEAVRPSAVVVVREPGRVLDRADVERSLGAPVVAEVAVDPAVARAVDAGLARSRLPRSFLGALAAVSA